MSEPNIHSSALFSSELTHFLFSAPCPIKLNCRADVINGSCKQIQLSMGRCCCHIPCLPQIGSKEMLQPLQSLSNICAEMLLMVIAVKALTSAQNASWARKQSNLLVLNAVPALAVIERLIRNLPLYFEGKKARNGAEECHSRQVSVQGGDLLLQIPTAPLHPVPGSLEEASVGTHLVLPGGFRHPSPRSESHHCFCL